LCRIGLLVPNHGDRRVPYIIAVAKGASASSELELAPLRGHDTARMPTDGLASAL